MPDHHPQLQRFSDEMKVEEILQYMVILHAIARAEDVSELNRYVKFVARVMSPDDFNKLIRRVTRMMGDNPCSDWLMTNLYELYKVYGTKDGADV
jgi:hypothetical protein